MMETKVLCSDCKHYRNYNGLVGICRLDLKENLNDSGGLTICKEWRSKR